MQKWSPEPFAESLPEEHTAIVAAADFEAEDTGIFGSVHTGSEARLFCPESGFADGKSLMKSLTPEERGQVYELVELDLVEEYQEREKQLRAEFAEQVAALQSDMTAKIEQWATDLAAITAREIKETSDAAARLAVEIAGKIARKAITADHTILARLIETAVYKISESQPLTIQASVPDAEWLSGQAELCQKLQIGEIVADRRVEPGGCLIRCGNREWDATLASQLDRLDEIVAEIAANNTAELSEAGLPPSAIGREPDKKPISEPEADDVTGLD